MEQIEDEIDLMDYVIILFKRKRTIIITFLLIVTVVLIFSFASKSVYKIDTVLEIGKVDSSLIESPKEISTKIEKDIYGIFARESLNISKEDWPNIKSESFGSNLIRIEIDSSEIETSKKILNEINEIILLNHEEVFNKKMAETKEDLREDQEELDFLKREKVYADQGIATLRSRVSSNTRKLAEAEMTEIVKSPTRSLYPIRPNKRLNVAIAAILGLFVGIFFAFSKEFWDKNKKRF